MTFDEISALGLNDQLSSGMIPRGLKVTVYEHANLGGNIRVYTRDTSSFPDFNDIISSFVVSEAEVCFYQHVSYKGSRMCASIGRARVDFNEIDDAGLNDQFSSVKVDNGAKVTAYEHKDLGGRALLFTEDADNFIDLSFNDIISSFVVELA